MRAGANRYCLRGPIRKGPEELLMVCFEGQAVPLFYLTREGDSWTYTNGKITVTGPDPKRVVLGVFAETRKAREEREKSPDCS